MLGLAPLAARAQLSFDFVYDTSMDPRALAGFQAAANRWSNLFSDPVTVTLNVGFSDLGGGILGGTNATQGRVSYGTFQSALAWDATSGIDVSVVNSLQPTSTFDLLVNRTAEDPEGPGGATPYLDNNGGANNSRVLMTLANARALGLYYAAGGGTDAEIQFNSTFAFDFDASDGIAAGTIDFVGVATHEIGHALGFISGVDVLGWNVPPFAGPYPDDAYTFVSPLDFLRYSDESRRYGRGVMDFTADERAKYFSIDGGDTALGLFATGTDFGDGSQASHWADDYGFGIMDPTAAYGERLRISTLDAAAFDAIGWDVRWPAPVPEPSTYGLAAVGALAGLILLRRRRR